MIKYIMVLSIAFASQAALAGTAAGGGSTMGLLIENRIPSLSNSILKGKNFLPIEYLGQFGDKDVVSIAPGDLLTLSRNPNRRVTVRAQDGFINSTVSSFNEDGSVSIKTKDNQEILVIPSTAIDENMDVLSD